MAAPNPNSHDPIRECPPDPPGPSEEKQKQNLHQ